MTGPCDQAGAHLRASRLQSTPHFLAASARRLPWQCTSGAGPSAASLDLRTVHRRHYRESDAGQPNLIEKPRAVIEDLLRHDDRANARREFIHREWLAQNMHSRIEVAIRYSRILRIAGNEKHLQIRPSGAGGVG